MSEQPTQDDYVAVIPRYVPVAPPAIHDAKVAAAPDPAPSQGGIFTNVYDNRIIIIAIIVVVLLIGILAYIIYYRSDAPSTNDRARPHKPVAEDEDLEQPPPRAPAPQRQYTQAELNAIRNRIAARQPPPAGQPPAQPVATPPAPQPVATPPWIGPAVPQDHTTNTDDETDEEDSILPELESEPTSDSAVSTATDQVIIQIDQTDPQKCSELTSAGKRCRNRALTGGKCRIHNHATTQAPSG